jgi:HK97 family phage portal protein
MLTMPSGKKGILHKLLYGDFPPPEAKAAPVAPAVPFSNTGWYGSFTTGGQMTGGSLPVLYAGSRVNYQQSVGELEMSSAIMACVQYVQRVFPEAPPRVVNRSDKGDEAIPDHPVTQLIDEPNPYMSWETVSQALLADYNVHGNAYLLKFRNGAGIPAELWYEPQISIRPTWDPQGRQFLTGYQVWRTGKWYPLDDADVIHFRWSQDPRNPRMGVSPLRTVLRLVYNDEEAEAYTASILHNMGSPGAIISPSGDKTITQDQAQALMTYFNSRFTGDGRGSTMVATGGLQVATPSWNPKDLDLTAIHYFSETRISGLMQVAAIVAGLGVGLEHATYANYQAAREATYRGNIVPTYTSFADTLTRSLLRDDFNGQKDQFVEFDTSNVSALQEDATAVADRAAKLFTAGIIDRAAALKMVDLESVPADDGIYLLPRGASFSDGSIAEPVSPVIEKVNTEPGANNLAPAPVATNGNQPAAAAQAAVPIAARGA